MTGTALVARTCDRSDGAMRISNQRRCDSAIEASPTARAFSCITRMCGGSGFFAAEDAEAEAEEVGVDATADDLVDEAVI